MTVFCLVFALDSGCTSDPPQPGETAGEATSAGETATTGEDTETTGESTSEGTTEDPTEGTTENPTEGTTEDPTEGTTGEGTFGGSCEDTPEVIAVDAASALGFSASEVLEGKLGPRDTSLVFYEEPLSLSDAIKGATWPLTVTLRYEGGEIRMVTSVAKDEDAEGWEPWVECADRLEIDVELDFVSEGGEFNETVAATLRATAADRATLMADLFPPGLSGSLDPQSLYDDPMWVVTALAVGGTWEGEAAGGSLMNEVAVEFGDEGFIGYGPLAAWGDPIADDPDFP